MGKTTFSGPVVSLAGFNPSGYSNIVNHPSTSATLSLTANEHGGRLVSLTGDHTLVTTLPAINGTDPVDETNPGQTSNYGLTFRLMISNTITSLIVNCAAGDEYFGGLTITTEAIGASDTFFAVAADNYNVITIASAATGWEPGGILQLTATDQGWLVTESRLLGIGTPTIPFTAV